MLSSITIKRNNHWLYHSEASRKQEMLTQLISDYADKSILIAVSQKEKFSLEEVENVTIMSDDEIMLADGQQFDLVIHADLPVEASHYIKRLSYAKELSIGLLLAEESQLVYQIETLLGRAIMQKYLEGFEPVKKVREESVKQREQKPYQQKKKFGKPADPNKRRQRNHHKDGTVRTEEERAEYQTRRAKSGNKSKSFGDKKSDNKSVEPKRKPRTFKIKTSKKDGAK